MLIFVCLLATPNFALAATPSTAWRKRETTYCKNWPTRSKDTQLKHATEAACKTACEADPACTACNYICWDAKDGITFFLQIRETNCVEVKSDCNSYVLYRQFPDGCGDKSREGFTNVEAFPDIAACAGSIAPGTDVSLVPLCSPGWHVCSGVDVFTKHRITFKQAVSFPGCFVYDANNDCQQCFPTCRSGSKADSINGHHGCDVAGRNDPDLAAMGNDCKKFDGSFGCISGGRINSGDPGCLINSKSIGGVICCRDPGYFGGTWQVTPPIGCVEKCGTAAGSGHPGAVTCSSGHQTDCDPKAKPEPPQCPATPKCGTWLANGPTSCVSKCGTAAGSGAPGAVVCSTGFNRYNSDGVCEDTPGWKDKDGDNCAAYNTCLHGGFQSRGYAHYATYANNDGITALDACCRCGGATRCLAKDRPAPKICPATAPCVTVPKCTTRVFLPLASAAGGTAFSDCIASAVMSVFGGGVCKCLCHFPHAKLPTVCKLGAATINLQDERKRCSATSKLTQCGDDVVVVHGRKLLRQA